MKQKLTLMIIAGVVLTAAAWTYGKAEPAPQKWEYLFQTECNQVQANGLGIQGWELVGMDPASSHRQCIYKRPLF
jgi:hypothetical protein